MSPKPFEAQKHYKDVSTWWNTHKWPVIPLAMLPPTGFVIEGVCAGWLYLTDSPIALLEWVVANPNTPVDERGQGLDALVARLKEEAKARGKSFVFMTAKNERLINRLEKHGFQRTDEHMTNLLVGV